MAAKRRLRVSHDLGNVANLVFESYLDFLTTPDRPEEVGDPKAFAARHTAALTAFAHLEKLEKYAERHGDEAQHKAVSGLLAEARQALSGTTTEQKEDQDGDAGGAA